MLSVRGSTKPRQSKMLTVAQRWSHGPKVEQVNSFHKLMLVEKEEVFTTKGKPQELGGTKRAGESRDMDVAYKGKRNNVEGRILVRTAVSKLSMGLTENESLEASHELIP